MLYLIGGASRAGKSTLAGRLCVEHQTAWFCLDILRMALFRAEPTLGFDPNRDDLVEAVRLWPIVREMVERLLDDGRDYAIESSCLRPSDVAATIGEFEGRVAGCFLGYADLPTSRKAGQIARYAGGLHDWLSDKPVAYIRDHIERNRLVSLQVREQCQERGLAYFDSGLDFPGAIEAARVYLMGAKRGHGNRIPNSQRVRPAGS